jgi:hypothetical protein
LLGLAESSLEVLLAETVLEDLLEALFLFITLKFLDAKVTRLVTRLRQFSLAPLVVVNRTVTLSLVRPLASAYRTCFGFLHDFGFLCFDIDVLGSHSFLLNLMEKTRPVFSVLRAA